MVRHDRSILSHTGFKAMSILSVTGVFLLGLALSTEWIVRAVTDIFGNIYGFILALIFLLFALFLIFSLFRYDFSRLKGQFPKIIGAVILLLTVLIPLFIVLQDGGEMQEFGALGDIEQGLNIWLIILLVFILMILLLMAASFIRLLYEITRMLYGFLTDKRLPGGPPPEFERIIIDEESSLFKARKPKVTNQIRRIYRKFLKLCIMRGIVIEPSQTTEDIAGNFANTTGEYKNTFALRDIYVDSRYGEKAVNAEDIKECKEIYNKLKKGSYSRYNG